MLSLIHSLHPIAFTIPNPHPEKPPGTDPLFIVMNWISWVCIMAALAGFLISAGSLAWAHHTGRPFDSFKGLAYAIASAILVGSAGLIMQSFT